LLSGTRSNAGTEDKSLRHTGSTLQVLEELVSPWVGVGVTAELSVPGRMEEHTPKAPGVP